MAAVTLLGTATFDTASGSKTVTATPATGDLIVIVTAHTGSTSGTSPSDNQTGLYTLTNNCAKAASADRLQIFVRTTLVTAAQAVSTIYTHVPGTTTGGGIAVFKITGMTRFSSDAILQSAIQSNQAAAGTPTPVLAAAALTANALIGAVFNATNPATMTPRTSWTERNDSGYATPTAGLETMSRDSGETASSIAWGGTSASAFCSLVIELNTSAAPINVALTGQSGTAARGLLLAAAALALTGQGLTSAPGSVSPGVTVALTGQSVSAAQGALAPATSVAETGQSVTAAQGSVAVFSPDVTVVLTGQSISVARGSIAASASFALTGQAAAVARGTVAPSVSFALNGQSLAVARGLVASEASLALVGLGVVAARGSVAVAASPDVTVALTGQALTSARGSVVPAFSFKLRGPPDPSGGEFEPPSGSLQTVLSLGDVAVSSSSTALLTGQSVTAARGSLGVASSPGLTGQAVTSAFGAVSPTSSLALTGQSGAAAQGLVTVASNIVVALTGQALTAARGTVTAIGGDVSAALSGQSIVSAQGNVSAVTGSIVALTGQSLAVSSGSVLGAGGDITRALTGQSLTAEVGFVVKVVAVYDDPADDVLYVDLGSETRWFADPFGQRRISRRRGHPRSE